jgi:tricorn protease
VADGRDPQLERAIEVILEGIRINPPTERARPNFPNRVRGG